MRIFAAFWILLASLHPASAQNWTAEQLRDPSIPAEIVPETQALANDGIPDGLMATYEGGDIAAAWYAQPTKRYRHAILGDGIEAGMLKIRDKRGSTQSVTLPKSEVFEDRTPRLFDLDNDGTVEVITILSSVKYGASVAIYGLKGDLIVKKSQTKFIGRSNRWLNIAGIGKFFGVKGNEILYVQTPHIGGNLFVLKYHKGDTFQQVLAKGFSNHVIGSREMRLSAIADVNGDGRSDIAIPSADRRTLRIIGFTGNKFHQIAAVALPSPIDKAIGVKTVNSKAGFVVGLEDSTVYFVSK